MKGAVAALHAHLYLTQDNALGLLDFEALVPVTPGLVFLKVFTLYSQPKFEPVTALPRFAIAHFGLSHKRL